MPPLEDTLILNVKGVPHPQPRPRWVNGHMISCTNNKVKLWADAVRKAGAQLRESLQEDLKISDILGEAEIELQLNFKMPTSQSERWGKYHYLKPDVDNLSKLVMDNLFIDTKSKGKSLLNCSDERIARLVANKKWAPQEHAGVFIVVKRLYRQDLDLGNKDRCVDIKDELYWLNL